MTDVLNSIHSEIHIREKAGSSPHHTKIMYRHVVGSMVKAGNFGKLVILESFGYFSVSRLIGVKGTGIVQTIAIPGFSFNFLHLFGHLPQTNSPMVQTYSEGNKS